MPTNKTVLITGGGSGIGRAAALAFAELGMTIIIAGRRTASCEETAVMASDVNPGCRTVTIEADVTDPVCVDTLFARIADQCGSLDIAFLNAGTGGAGDIIDQPLDAFSHIFAVNCTGTWLCLKHCFRAMRGRGGAIVTNLSVHASRTIFTGAAAYTASKHAAMALTKAAAIEGAGLGIRVNGVAPGPVLTDMLVSSCELTGGTEAWARKIPQKRVGRPEEIAAAVVWLSSDHASFVNGAILNVDGGFLAV